MHSMNPGCVKVLGTQPLLLQVWVGVWVPATESPVRKTSRFCHQRFRAKAMEVAVPVSLLPHSFAPEIRPSESWWRVRWQGKWVWNSSKQRKNGLTGFWKVGLSSKSSWWRVSQPLKNPKPSPTALPWRAPQANRKVRRLSVTCCSAKTNLLAAPFVHSRVTTSLTDRHQPASPRSLSS